MNMNPVQKPSRPAMWRVRNAHNLLLNARPLLRDKLQESLEELPFEDVTALLSTLPELQHIVVQHEEAEKAAATRKKTFQDRAAWLEEYLLLRMLRVQQDYIERGGYQGKIKQNPPAVIVTGPLPEGYLRQPPIPAPVPDKPKIKTALIQGEDIPHAHLQTTYRLEVTPYVE